MKLFFKLLGAGLVLAATFPLYLGILIGDAALPQDEDLSVSIPTLGTNAYDDLAQIGEAWVKADDAFNEMAPLTGAEWDSALAEIWLEDNQASLELLDEAVTRDGFLEPSFTEGIPDFLAALPTLNHLPSLARLACLDAVVALKAGDDALAEQRLAQVMTLGHMIQEAPGTLLQQLIGVTLKKTALETALAWQISIDDLEQYADHFSGYELAHKTEYQLQIDMVDRLVSGELTWAEVFSDLPLPFFTRYHFYPNLTKQKFAERTQLALAQSGECDDPFFDDGPDALKPWAYIRKNLAGDWLVYGLAPRIATSPFCELATLYQEALSL